MAYKAGELTGPFWAENSGLANGRDPLGIQNSSVATYVKLLPGITNVTSHIRYYGFYCWLLERYIADKKIDNNNNLKQQLFYIRKSELLLAYVVKAVESEKFNGVGGAAFVERDLKDNPNASYVINLDKNASFYTKSNTAVYWKLRSGVFGQYYIGVLKDLGLIGEPQGTNHIYVPTESGRKLANAFAENISSPQKNSFLQAINDGEINKKLLNTLSAFHLGRIPIESKEWAFYIDLMKGNDLPGNQTGNTKFRKATVSFYLNFLKQNTGLEFLEYCYKTPQAGVENEFDSAWGWKYYALNEYAHIAYEHIFCSLLYSLKPYPLDLDNIINTLSADSAGIIIKDLKLVNSDIKLSDVIKSVRNNEKYYNSLWDTYKDKQAQCIANAILVLIILFKENLKEKESLIGFARETDILRGGNAFGLFSEILEKNEAVELGMFIRNTLYQALNDHLFSSYNKAALNQKDMFNILVEENTARRVREMEPAFTSPRIGSLNNFLKDLQLITPGDKPINNALKIFA